MSESERLTKENVTLRGILIAVGVLVIGVLLWYAHKHIPEPVSVLLKTLAETLLIAGFVGILYDLFLRRRFKDEMAIMISRAINANADFLREKMGGEVDSIIKTFHDKETNYYTAYLFDPTYEPKITLKYNDDMKNPFDLTYFMSKTHEAKLGPSGENYIRISTKIPEWVFPTSGVVFIWTPRK